MTQFYWELVQFDGTKIDVPPDAVAVIQKRMDSKQAIHTAYSGSIPINQIKHFRPTDRLYGQTNMLEAETAQIFNEPVINPDGSIGCRWVKKVIPQRIWEKDFSSKGFKRLDNDNGMVTVAMFKPIHQIDPYTTPYCTADEVAKLNKERSQH